MRFARWRTPRTTVDLRGQFGNQLFQLAAGLTVQRTRGGSLRLTRYPRRKGSDLRSFFGSAGVADVLGDVRYIRRHKALSQVTRKIRRALRDFLRKRQVDRGVLFIERQRSAFDPIPQELSESTASDVLLFGFFQHPAWYEPSVDIVTSRIWNQISHHLSIPEAHDATVISVRRGDYVYLGWDLPLSYYERALDTLGTVDGPVWIVSSEPDATELLQPLLSKHNLTASPLPELGTSPAVRDFLLLCAARNVIMSNSTFCWWATVTGDVQRGQPRSTVIAPSEWLPGRPKSRILQRPNWQIVEAEFVLKERVGNFDR